MILAKRRQMFLAERDSTCDVRHIDANHRFSLLRRRPSKAVYVDLHHFLMAPVTDNIAVVIEMRNPARNVPTDPSDKPFDGTGVRPERGPYVSV